MDQAFAVPQVCEKHPANWKMYSGHLWIFKCHMILLVDLLCAQML